MFNQVRLRHLMIVLFLGLSANVSMAQEKLDLDKLWKDLEKNEPESTVAILKLAQRPEETVKFLEKKLIPLVLEEKEFEELMEQLGAEDADKWKPAFEKLSYLDPRLHMDLEALMEEFDENPTRNRLIEILCDTKAGTYTGKDIQLRKTARGQYNFKSGNSSWWAEASVERLNSSFYLGKKKWRQATRAVILLEHIGTKDSMRVLLRLSSGHEKAQPTRVAKAAALRLKAKLKKEEK